MKRRILYVVVLALLTTVTGCAQLSGYCSEQEMRAAIRQLNPYDFIDAAAIASCAAAEAFVIEQSDGGNDEYSDE